MAITPAPDSAQLGSLVRIGVKEAETALGSSGQTRFARFGSTLTTGVKILVSHFVQAQRWIESVSRGEAGNH